METEIVKMSAKGQLVVPQNIRDAEAFEPGDRFMPFPVKEGVLFKKVEIPSPQEEFEKISKEIQAKFKKKRISSKDVQKATGWARKKLS